MGDRRTTREDVCEPVAFHNLTEGQLHGPIPLTSLHHLKHRHSATVYHTTGPLITVARFDRRSFFCQERGQIERTRQPAITNCIHLLRQSLCASHGKVPLCLPERDARTNVVRDAYL